MLGTRNRWTKQRQIFLQYDLKCSNDIASIRIPDLYGLVRSFPWFHPFISMPLSEYAMHLPAEASIQPSGLNFIEEMDMLWPLNMSRD